jgi:hypothetical protein
MLMILFLFIRGISYIFTTFDTKLLIRYCDILSNIRAHLSLRFRVLAISYRKYVLLSSYLVYLLHVGIYIHLSNI